MSGRELKSPEVFDEEKAIEEIKALSKDARVLIKVKLRGHLTIVLNTEGKSKAYAIEDLGHEFRKLGLY